MRRTPSVRMHVRLPRCGRLLWTGSAATVADDRVRDANRRVHRSPWRRHRRRRHRVDRLRRRWRSSTRSSSAIAAMVLAELAARYRRRRDHVAGHGRLQRRRHPRTIIATGRERLKLECAGAEGAATSSTSSRTADAAGSGRPNRSARCPTSRGSLPTTSNASPRSCSAASSPTCCRSKPRLRLDRGAQDAGFPSVGAISLLRRGRSPGQRARRPLVAVRQSDLRRAAVASSASAGSAPTSPSSASRSARSHAWRGSTR